jgi:hypothetical protein
VQSLRQGVLILICGCVLAAVPAWAGAIGGLDTSKGDPKPAIKGRSTEPTYSITAGLDGEIFPVFANYASLRRPRQRQWGIVSVKVTNSTDAVLKGRLAVQVPGWSDQEIQLVEVSAGASRIYLFAPSFLPRLYENKEIVAATAMVMATDAAGRLTFSDTVPVRLRSADDMYWGADFKYAQFIASWVTPHDREVERILGRAKEFTPRRRLPGYERDKTAALQERGTYLQAKAIYRALQQKGISYVKSSLTFGGHQDVSERVRMPFESLHQESANCIDGAVMYASLFENLGMDPVVLLVPGHAYVGVRVSREREKYLFIETSLTGRGTFAAAVQSAERGLAKYSANQVIRVPIHEARVAGIYPMPSPTGLVDPKAPPMDLKAEKTAE